jgi:hypothetical protein
MLVYLYLQQQTYLGHWIQLFDDGIVFAKCIKLFEMVDFRFEKRIYIPLPEVNERAGMFKINLGAGTHHTIKENEWMQLAQRAEQ